MLVTERVYNDRDNLVDLLLKADGSAYDLSSVTKIVLIVGGTTVTDTGSTAWPIKWTGLGTTGKVSMKLGDQSFTAGNYMAEVYVYDATNTNGIFWGKFEGDFRWDVGF